MLRLSGNVFALWQIDMLLNQKQIETGGLSSSVVSAAYFMNIMKGNHNLEAKRSLFSNP